MHPVLIEIGGFELASFGVMVALGFLAGLWFTTREARRTGVVPEALIGDLFVWIMVGGLLGARILYVAVHWEQFRDAPIDVLKYWKGGIVSIGGFFGAFLAGWIFTRRRGVRFLVLADVCMPGALLGQAIGRIGCFLVGDDYGRPAPDLPWAVTFPVNPDSLLPKALQGVPIHPTQLYMMLKAFLIFAVLVWLSRRKRFDGQLLYAAMILYSALRWIVEIYRGDETERGIYFGLSTAQWLLVPVFVAGCIGYARGLARARAGVPLAAVNPPSRSPS